MENSEIIWTGSPDDQTARIGDYVLRVRSKGKWYKVARIYFKGNQIALDFTITEKRAKTACEKAYYEHLKTCKD